MSLRRRCERLLGKDESGELPDWNAFLFAMGGLMLWKGLFSDVPSYGIAALGAAIILLWMVWLLWLVGPAKTWKLLSAAVVGVALAALVMMWLERMGLSWLTMALTILLLVVGIITIVTTAFDWLSARMP